MYSLDSVMKLNTVQILLQDPAASPTPPKLNSLAAVVVSSVLVTVVVVESKLALTASRLSTDEVSGNIFATVYFFVKEHKIDRKLRAKLS